MVDTFTQPCDFLWIFWIFVDFLDFCEIFLDVYVCLIDLCVLYLIFEHYLDFLFFI